MAHAQLQTKLSPFKAWLLGSLHRRWRVFNSLLERAALLFTHVALALPLSFNRYIVPCRPESFPVRLQVLPVPVPVPVQHHRSASFLQPCPSRLLLVGEKMARSSIVAVVLAWSAALVQGGNNVQSCLRLTAVFDPPVAFGQSSRGVELYAHCDVADMGQYALTTVMSSGSEHTLALGGSPEGYPVVPLSAGSFFYVANVGFPNFFSFSQDFTHGCCGDLARGASYELTFQSVHVDTFGLVDTSLPRPHVGQPWVYMGGWAYRVSGTGPDGDTHVQANWEYHPTDLAGYSSNAVAPNYVPVGAFSESAAPSQPRGSKRPVEEPTAPRHVHVHAPSIDRSSVDKRQLVSGSFCSTTSPCSSDFFCNFDFTSSGTCEACSGCSTCSSCGLPSAGVSDCASSCTVPPDPSPSPEPGSDNGEASPSPQPDVPIYSCDAAASGTGVYTVQGSSVLCDMDTDGGGWTLVYSGTSPPQDFGGSYHANLATLQPFASNSYNYIWNGLNELTGGVNGGGNSDFRVSCATSACTSATSCTMDVDLAFYNLNWYNLITSGANDAAVAFHPGGDTTFAPARRTLVATHDRTANEMRCSGTTYSSGSFEGEENANDVGDFTVDFDDRGMDSQEQDGTDWGLVRSGHDGRNLCPLI